MSFTLIDDRDPSITYTGTWVQGGTAHEHDGTVSSSVTAGNSFSVPFTGTSIGVYGTYDSSSAGVKTSYAIDKNTAVVVTSTASSGSDVYQQLFWQSGHLANTSHTLVVTMKAINPNQGAGEGTIWFDFFNVTEAAAEASSASASTTGSSIPSLSRTPPASQTKTRTATSSSSSSTSSAVVATDSNKSRSHAGVVAGIIVALLVVLGLAGAYYWRRRRTRFNRSSRVDMMASGGGPSPMTPMGALPSSSGSAYPPQVPPIYGLDAVGLGAAGASFGEGYAPLSSRSPSTLSLDPYARAGTEPAFSVSSAPSSQSRGPLSVVNHSVPASDQTSYYSDSIADLKRRQREVVNSYEQGVRAGSPSLIQHVDSGVRALPADHEDSAPIELPPVYTPH